MRLHQVATIATRPDKQKHSLATLTGQWRDRAAGYVAADDQLAFVSSLENRNDLPLLRSGDLGDAILADAAEAVVATVAERHSTYGRHNLLAEAHRVLHGVRFASSPSQPEQHDQARSTILLRAGVWFVGSRTGIAT